MRIAARRNAQARALATFVKMAKTATGLNDNDIEVLDPERSLEREELWRNVVRTKSLKSSDLPTPISERLAEIGNKLALDVVTVLPAVTFGYGI